MKCCALDPLPATLMTKCLPILPPVITKIVNLSLSTALIPDLLKLTIISPTLKKTQVNHEEFKNFRPVCNLAFLSKIIETWEGGRISTERLSYCLPDLSNRTVRQSNPIEHQSFDCRTQSNIIELTIKFCQSNTIERSITERLVIEPNRTFDYRTTGIIERSLNERRIAWYARGIGKFRRWKWNHRYRLLSSSPRHSWPLWRTWRE